MLLDFQKSLQQHITTLPLCAHRPNLSIITGLRVFLLKKKIITLTAFKAASFYLTYCVNKTSISPRIRFRLYCLRRGLQTVILKSLITLIRYSCYQTALPILMLPARNRDARFLYFSCVTRVVSVQTIKFAFVIYSL